MKWNKLHLIHKTGDDVEIRVGKGDKSSNDFIVKYKEHGKRGRTPKHIHWAVDLLLKKQTNPGLTADLVKHLIDIAARVKPSILFPPKLQFFDTSIAPRFSSLNGVGDYSIEFLLIVVELLMIQERTNYPSGTMNLKLLEKILDPDAGVFEIVSKATFRGP